MVIDAVLMTSRVTSSNGAGPFSGGASGAATPPSAIAGLGASSRWDCVPHAVTKPNIAIAEIANVTHWRIKLQEVPLMAATMPFAVNFDHFRWLDSSRGHPSVRLPA